MPKSKNRRAKKSEAKSSDSWYFTQLRGMAMSFEDVEALKTAFTVYNVPERPKSSDTTPKTIMKLRNRSITHTRIIVAPPIHGVKHHFKMLLFSMFSKLRLKHA